MPLLFIYLLKLSVSLAVMYLFYQLLLRRLTFYNHNRWYLIGYSLLCFFIPLINISDVLEKNEAGNNGIVTIVPAVETYTAKLSPDATLAGALGDWTIWNWLMTLVVFGIALLLLRLVIQFFSFRVIKRKAELIADDQIKFYHVDKNIIPFSFGNSIFINQHLHTEAELKEIIRHEFVHIKQRHTLDIIFSELLCILNWYNPFAWLIRKAIRQNLEFIADNKVVENGTDKKQYQYLLLKVIGNNHFSIASNFNFSSLKKRIAMMNKISSAKVHLIKFLFVLPLIAIVVLAFRKEEPSLKYAVIVYDAETLKPIPDVRVKGIYTNVEYTTDAAGYIEIPVSVDKENKMHISYDFTKDGYIKWWNRKFETDFKNGKPNSVIELISLKKGADEGLCDICGAASQDYGFSGLKLSLEEEAIEFFNLLMKAKKKQSTIIDANSSISSIDTVPGKTIINAKGYYIDIKDNKGNCMVVIKDKDDKEVKKLLLTDWNKKENYYEDLYGEIPLASANCEIPAAKAMPVQLAQPAHPLQPPQLAQPVQSVQPLQPAQPVQSAQPLQPASPKSPVKLKSYTLTDESNKPLVIVDGVEWPASLDMNMIDANKIESVSVLKDGSAVNQYGDKGKKGVVIITTKKEVVKSTQSVRIRAQGVTATANPIYYLNGKQTTKEAVELIEPTLIKSVDVLKGSKAEEKYGEKGKNGVIEIEATIPAEVNYIEKKKIPEWDFKNFLPGKKKDEC